MRHQYTNFALLTLALMIVCIGPLSATALADSPTWRCDGPFGASIRSLAVSPDFAQDGVLLAGADEGMYRSEDGGDSWEPVAGIVQGINVASVSFSPVYANDPIVFCASNQGGISKSLDGGENWALWSDGLASLVAYHVVTSPEFGTDQTVFCATDRGLFKTTSSGKRWFSVGPTTTALSVAVGPQHGDGLTVLGGTISGLYRSLDGGDTWEPTSLWGVPVTAVAVSSDLNVALAGTLAGLYVSTDIGETWSGPWYSDQVIHSVHCSSDVGPTQTLLAGSADGALMSIDRGESWQAVAQVDDATYAVASSPGAAGLALWAGTSHLGVLYSPTLAGPWVTRQQGITGRHIDTVEVSPDFKRDVAAFCGGPDGLWRTMDDAQTWEHATIADVGVNDILCSPGYGLDGTVWAATDGGLFVSDNCGESFATTPGILPSLNVSALAIASDGDIWAATSEGGVFYSDDNGANWSPRSTGLGTLSVTSLSLSESSESQHIIAGTWGRGVYHSDDGGMQWTPSATGPDSPHIRALASGVGFGDLVWSFCGSTAAIYRSGDLAETWDLSSELGLDVQDIALHPNYAQRTNAYAGALTNGVLRSTNGGLNWQQLNIGLGNLDVNAIDVGLDDETQPVIVAGTMGGVWRYGGTQRQPVEPETLQVYLPLLSKNSAGASSQAGGSSALTGQMPRRADR